MDMQKYFKECLKSNPDELFPAKKIAEWICDNYPEECEAEKVRTRDGKPKDDKAVKKQIYNQINNAWSGVTAKEPQFKRTEDSPKRYYYCSESELAGPNNQTGLPVASEIPAEPRLERELYPILADYLMMEFKIYSKYIDAGSSKSTRGRNGNLWLTPDLVGVEDISGNWNDNVKNCVGKMGGRQARLWAFEVKREIKSSDVRQFFFQAVSNSSWAHFGYLVVKEKLESKVLEELRILSGLHGIGLIELNTTDPIESIIRIPAQEKPEVDWDTINRIASENNDFLSVINELQSFYHNHGKIMNKDFWDAGLLTIE
jgi:hypothetical protein